MKRKWTTTRYLRLGSQVLFLILTAYAIIRHRIGESLGLVGPQNQAPSVDALSPFGGVETFWAWLTKGQLVSHVQYSDIVLFIALVALMLLAGASFCGWICPLGTLQEWLHRLRRRFIRGTVIIPPRLDRILRYGRYLVLLLVLILTYSLGDLVFGEYCPWRAAWHLGSSEIAVGGAIVLAFLVAGGLLVERAWCRYACPLGALVGLANQVAPLKLTRNDAACPSCGLCNRHCPMGVDVAVTESVTDTTCIRCLECAESCPRPETLDMRVGRRWRKKLPGWLYGVMSGGLFAGIILLSMATGIWHSTPSAAPPTADAASGLVDPLEIKGWRTLQEITDIYGIPASVLMGELGLDIATPASTRVKDLEGQVARDGSTVDVTLVRKVVERWQAGHPQGSGASVH